MKKFIVILISAAALVFAFPSMANAADCTTDQYAFKGECFDTLADVQAAQRLLDNQGEALRGLIATQNATIGEQFVQLQVQDTKLQMQAQTIAEMQHDAWWLHQKFLALRHIIRELRTVIRHLR